MSKYYNKTRTSDSIPKKLTSQGKWYLIPIYYFLTTSFLAKEGIESSGSYRFADHIYAQVPKGKYFLGWILDAILLKLPAAQAFRFRYIKVKEELKNFILENQQRDLYILYIPPGLGREFFEIDREIGSQLTSPKNIHLRGLDLDDELVKNMNNQAEKSLMNIHFLAGDAFEPENYGQQYDMIISTGFLDFLNNQEAEVFFSHVYSALKPGGKFITSGMLPYQLTEYLMKHFAELKTSYRSKQDLIELSEKAGFVSHFEFQEKHQIQTVIISQK